jgi:hypothetical protein
MLTTIQADENIKNELGWKNNEKINTSLGVI